MTYECPECGTAYPAHLAADQCCRPEWDDAA